VVDQILKIEIEIQILKIEIQIQKKDIEKIEIQKRIIEKSRENNLNKYTKNVRIY